MIVSYKGFPYHKGIIYRPMMEIKIRIGANSFKTLGLLDSGCDRTLINKQIGKQLGVDFSKCTQSATRGISRGQEITWESEIDIEVIGFNAGTKKSKVSFIASDNVGILLGHIGFFEFYKVQFETFDKKFTIDIP